MGPVDFRMKSSSSVNKEKSKTTISLNGLLRFRKTELLDFITFRGIDWMGLARKNRKRLFWKNYFKKSCAKS